MATKHNTMPIEAQIGVISTMAQLETRKAIRGCTTRFMAHILIIGYNEGATGTVIARGLGKKPKAMYKTLVNMIRYGYIARSGNVYHLTDWGKRIFTTLSAHLQQAYKIARADIVKHTMRQQRSYQLAQSA